MLDGPLEFRVVSILPVLSRSLVSQIERERKRDISYLGESERKFRNRSNLHLLSVSGGVNVSWALFFAVSTPPCKTCAAFQWKEEAEGD